LNGNKTLFNTERTPLPAQVNRFCFAILYRCGRRKLSRYGSPAANLQTSRQRFAAVVFSALITFVVTRHLDQDAARQARATWHAQVVSSS
jgi:hypothetical protein